MFIETKKLKDVSLSSLENAIALAISELIGAENGISCSIVDLDFQGFGAKLSLTLSSDISDPFDVKP